MNNGNSKRRIASLALFRNLYNEGTSDVMTILCEFAKDVVYSKHLTGFTPTHIKNELKNEYEFYIPEYVVESVLKKFCKKSNSLYYPKEDEAPQKVNKQEITKIEQSHKIIVSKLVSYVEERISKKLSSDEKTKLFQSFCEFLIDESEVEYAEYISTFIINIQDDMYLSQLLRTIKEGVVLYTGIQYNDSVNETGSWKNEFTIYLEQEILFHMAGYNGELYKQLFQDFWALVTDINKKARKQLIKVKYFDAVKIEIGKFFRMAERIIDGKETLDYSNIAMTTILQGCEHKSDVVAKECAFFENLKNHSITEENGEMYWEENSQYNIYYPENVEELSRKYPQRDIEWSLQLLNYTSLIRKGHMSGFENSRCILLTGNSTTMAVAFHPSIKQNGDVPLSTTLDYITNKLWFKLNKGFGSDSYPKSFNIVTKAQIVLSAQVAGSVAAEFEKIKQEISRNEKPETTIIAELAELKSRVKKPEEVNVSEIDDILSTITMADTEQFLREREMERLEAERQKEEIKRLQADVEKMAREQEELRKNSDKYKKEVLEAKKKTLEQINNQLAEINALQQVADVKVQKRINHVKWIPWAVIVIFMLGVGFGTYIYGWEKMELLTWIISTIMASIPYLGFAIGSKSFNPQNIINVTYKELYQQRVYIQMGVNLTKKEYLESQKKELVDSMPKG